jgi:dTDP-4-amino-4,6-dideoxygalactose transaminase
MGDERERPLGYGRQSIDGLDVEAVVRVLRGAHLTQGPEVPRFERALGQRCASGQGAHAAACSSGTAALQLALLALDVGPGSRVVTSANTFLASATAALWCGADVEFVDVGLRSGNLDAEALAERLASGPRVDAVVAVHFAGLPCAMERLLELKREHGFALVEDASHALGATYEAGGATWRPGGHPEVDAACFSFHPVKHVTTGEGGAVVSARAELVERARRLAAHGIDRATSTPPFADSDGVPPWFAPMEELGLNHRLSDLAAALGTSQLARLDAFLARRRAFAERYDELLAGLPLERPALEAGHAWHLYVVHLADRDAVMGALAEQGIGTQVHYYPVPHQPWFRRRLGEPDCPRAEAHARTCLSLPLHAELSDADQDRVVRALGLALGAG